MEKEVFLKIIYQKYSFFLNNNSSKLLRDMQVCTVAFPRLISSLIILLSEFILVLMILVLIFMYSSYQIILGISAFFPIIYIFLKISKKYLTKEGDNLHTFSKNKIETIKSAFDAINEIKTIKLEKNVFNNFNKFSKITIDSLMKLNKVQILPRYILEFSLIVGLIISTYLMFANEYSSDEILVFIALMTASAFRVIPSISKILNSVQMIHFYLPSIPSLIYYINFKFNMDKKIYPKKLNSLKINNIKFSYKGSNKLIINNLNLSINKGSKILITGKSGCGKTTFIKILLGLLKPNSGIYKLNNNDESNNWEKLNLNLSYVPQSVYIFDDTIYNNIVISSKDRSNERKKFINIINILELNDFLDEFPKKENTFLGEDGSRISGGQKQKIGIARALFSNPDLLILDEATNSLDAFFQNRILEILISKYNDLCIICISHDRSVIKKFEQKYKFINGKILKI